VLNALSNFEDVCNFTGQKMNQQKAKDSWGSGFHLPSGSCPGRAKSFSGNRTSTHLRSSELGYPSRPNSTSGPAKVEPRYPNKEGLPRGILGAPALTNRGSLSASANPTRTVCPFLRRPRVPKCLNHEFTCVHHESLRQSSFLLQGSVSSVGSEGLS
jgi:hypothetical protein